MKAKGAAAGSPEFSDSGRNANRAQLRRRGHPGSDHWEYQAHDGHGRPRPDADGYAVAIDEGPETAIAGDDTLQLDNIEAGDHGVRVTRITENCAVEGENPHRVTFEAGAAAAFAFIVECTTAQPTTGRATMCSSAGPYEREG